MEISTQNQRVIVYIDGFNLYFGLKSKFRKQYLWLNLLDLSNSLLKNNQRLIGVKYFTARIKSPDDKRMRQSNYIEALELIPEIEIIYGNYQESTKKCSNCQYEMKYPQEKKTDVNIAVSMVMDAVDDRYDTAMLISGDSDLTPAVEAIKQKFSPKRIVVAFPPNRKSKELKKVSNATIIIGEAKFRKSLFPEIITKPDGHTLIRPKSWR
ncbi:MAG: NYN domain-containing protein [bacterium]|nr:NYN domain-containing protein [bacterium]